ncbi:hypothetical protein OG21DRAFT_371936 [Imleria badia]|nr:hypothetical protein OG21DRAFT_371936 [Imleria badia]
MAIAQHPPSPDLFNSSSMANPGPLAPPHPATWRLQCFANALHRSRAHSHQYGIRAVQYYSRLGCQNESLILDVVPLEPGSSIPQVNPTHTYLKFCRYEDLEAEKSFLGYAARDEVIVIGQALQDQDKCISTLSWPAEVPNLVDAFDVIKMFSFMFPRFNSFSSFYFTPIIYETLRRTYDRYDQVVGDKFWKQAIFFLIFHLGTPAPPPPLLSFSHDRKQCRETALGH